MALLFELLDPYIKTRMDWLPIIIICSIVGSIFVFFVFPLMLFACFKSRQRRVEKVERRETLAQSLRASRESLASTRGGRALRASRESLDSLGGAGIDTSKRRRPPLGTGTYDEDVTFSDSADKSKYDYFRQMSPQTSVDYASTKWDGESSYNYDDTEMGAGMPLCENEIATVPAESRFRSPAAASAYPPPYQERPNIGGGGYYDDDASVTQSLMGSNFRRHQRPRPAPSYDSPSGGGLGVVDETESVAGSSRPTSDTSSVLTTEGRKRPPRPRLP